MESVKILGFPSVEKGVDRSSAAKSEVLSGPLASKIGLVFETESVKCE